MSGIYLIIGFIVFLVLVIWKVSSWRMSSKKVDKLVQANKIKERVDEAVTKKELEHKKNLSAASDFERATRMWNDKPPKAR
ncbi:hypothetical protein LCGC14_0725600 [marine sediment metagenome]|uniref:Uncharacterized protein n=1 Tax=marine sediment metagenome TaxID=412755 RepID=A0A0F9QFB3_9ZZZZ